MSVKSQAILNGKLFSLLREKKFIPITQKTSKEELKKIFDAEPKAFWKAVQELEKNRELRKAPEGLYFIEPSEAW